MKRLTTIALAFALAACGGVSQEAPQGRNAPSELSATASETFSQEAPARAGSEATASEGPKRDYGAVPEDFLKSAFDGVGEPREIPGVDLEGTDDFKRRVTEALATLGKCNPKALAFVQLYQTRVQLGDMPENLGAQTNGTDIWLARRTVYGWPGAPAEAVRVFTGMALVHETEHVRQLGSGYRYDFTRSRAIAAEMDALRLEVFVGDSCLSILSGPAREAVQSELRYRRDVLNGDEPCDVCEGFKSQ